MSINYTIVPLSVQYIKEVAAIHSKSLPDDFLPNLGFDFLVKTFYPAVLGSEYGKVLIAFDNEMIPVGFTLVTLNSGSFLKGIIKDRFIEFLKIGLRTSFTSLTNIFNSLQIVISGLFSNTTQTAGEIYIIAVSDSSRGKGIGKLLVERSISFMQECKIDALRIKTLSANTGWIGFFRKNGWKTEKEFRLIGNNYVLLLKQIN